MNKNFVLFITITLLSILFFSCKANIEVHEHTYSSRWFFDGEYHWHEATCEHSGLVSNEEKHKFGNAEIITKETCGDKGLQQYTCIVCGYKTIQEIEANKQHSWGLGLEVLPATEEREGIVTFVCKICGKTKSEYINKLAHTHKFSEEWSSDSEYHWHTATCGHNSEINDSEEHKWDAGEVSKTPSEEQQGERLYTCIVCNKSRIEYIDKLSHIHKFSEEWASDSEYHWHAATCGHNSEISDNEEHKWDAGEVSKTPSEEQQGERFYTCTVCNKSRIEYIDKLPHTHKFSEEWASDSEYHWHTAICGHNSEISDNEKHVLDNGVIYASPTCNTTGEKIYTCTICNKICKRETIPELGHSYLETWEKDDDYHWKKCLNCSSVFYKTEHSYDGSTFACTCGECRFVTIEEFITTIGTGVESITAYSTSPGIHKSVDGKTVNVYGVHIYGAFKNETNFKFPKSLKTADLRGLDTTSVSDMSYMFTDCMNLTSLDLSNFNTSNVTNMSAMFLLCTSLTNLDLSSFNTTNVTDMSFMFQGYPDRPMKLSNIRLSNFNTSKVTNMKSMFSYCTELTTVDVTNFDTSNVTNMHDMFGHCTSLTMVNLNNFDTSKVTIMSCMFWNCPNLLNLNLSSFNTTNVTDMSSMFSNCSGLLNLDLSGFTTSKLRSAQEMFYNCTSLKTLNLTNWDTTTLAYVSNLFFNCGSTTRPLNIQYTPGKWTKGTSTTLLGATAISWSITN